MLIWGLVHTAHVGSGGHGGCGGFGLISHESLGSQHASADVAFLMIQGTPAERCRESKFTKGYTNHP